MGETNKQTNITVAGKLTVTVNLKDGAGRYSAPDLKTEITMNFGASAPEIEATLDKELAALRRRLLIACGRVTIEE